MVELWLPYGTSEIPARIPEERLIDILKPQKGAKVLDASAELKHLLRSNLQERAKKARRICIAVGACSNKQLMVGLTDSFIQGLVEIGVARSSITILCTHNSVDLDNTKLPETQILRHDPTSSPTVAIQDFKGDFSLSLNSVLVGSDLKILLGELKPNHFIGFSGISDVVFPGLASEVSSQSQLSNRKGVTISDLHQERVEITDSLPNVIAVGFVLDLEQAPVKVSLGSIHECMNGLKAVFEEVYVRKMEKLSDIVVLSAGGMPYDESLLAAVEAFPAGLATLKRDGAMIVAAECSMGHGDREFYEWCGERKEPRYLEARLRHNFNYQGFKAAFLLRSLETHRIYLVSTIPDHYVENVFGLRAARTVNSALQTVQRTMGSDSTISIIPDASRVVPHQA